MCHKSHVYCTRKRNKDLGLVAKKKKSQVNNLRILNAIGTDLFTSNKNQTLDTFQHYTLQFYSCQGHQVNLWTRAATLTTWIHSALSSRDKNPRSFLAIGSAQGTNASDVERRKRAQVLCHATPTINPVNIGVVKPAGLFQLRHCSHRSFPPWYRRYIQVYGDTLKTNYGSPESTLTEFGHLVCASPRLTKLKTYYVTELCCFQWHAAIPEDSPILDSNPAHSLGTAWATWKTIFS